MFKLATTSPTRQPLQLLLTGLLSLLLWHEAFGLNTTSSQQSNPEDPKPNFVIIILDDWGWRESGAYGNPMIQTPNIDQLAQNGMQFHNAFLTASTCTPSRASILTGLYPFAAGTPKLHTSVPAEHKLLSHYLNQAGYFTAAAGKWHIGFEVINQFDLFVPERELSDRDHSGTEDWVETIKQLPVDQPFFLWLAAKDPHKPWTRDKKWAVHQKADIEIPDYVIVKNSQREKKIRDEIKHYYDEVYRADHHIGEAIKALEETGRRDNTVLIVMSDNGSPFWKAKRFLTDPGLKTPFIVQWPKRFQGHRDVHELISSVDIAPTLLELAGAGIPPQMEGHSFAHWLTQAGQKPEPIRQYVYGERGDPTLGSDNGRSIRDKHFLYIVNDYDSKWFCSSNTSATDKHHEQLFDVIEDPDNTDNLLLEKHWLIEWFLALTGRPDPQQTLQHFRKLMEQRRQQRNDMPEPFNPADCPTAPPEAKLQPLL